MLRTLATLAAVVALTWVGSAYRVVSAQPAAQPGAPMAATISRYMECEECTDRDVARVAGYGNPAVAPLFALLRQGPPQAAVDAKRAFIQAQYRQQAAYAQTHPESRPTMTEAQTVELYVRNYIRTYRERSAAALGQIKTPEARAARNQALNLPNLSATEKAAVRRALQ